MPPGLQSCGSGRVHSAKQDKERTSARSSQPPASPATPPSASQGTPVSTGGMLGIPAALAGQAEPKDHVREPLTLSLLAARALELGGKG